MLIRFAGDIHAEFSKYFFTLEGVTNSVQVGDYGIGFRDIPVNLRDHPGNHRFIRGNHDNPHLCSSYHNFIADGHTETIDGVKFMYLGGAYSIDKDWRTPGIDWWYEEELSYAELERMISIYEEFKPDVMVAHELPDTQVMPVFTANNPNFTKFAVGSRTRDAMNVMFEIHKPQYWIFGHWHKNARVNIEGTTFVCLDCHYHADYDTKERLLYPTGTFWEPKWV
jgi:Icc-related predicted phosphoesterase